MVCSANSLPCSYLFVGVNYNSLYYCFAFNTVKINYHYFFYLTARQRLLDFSQFSKHLSFTSAYNSITSDLVFPSAFLFELYPSNVSYSHTSIMTPALHCPITGPIKLTCAKIMCPRSSYTSVMRLPSRGL